ncbi:sigma-70 family RNA polymerase sigma factor [Flavitalea sp. BT771]|nr:sigma-70 family RNA polymerase sigma factor [Flavitalea sp. BT771]MDO6433032.1 sigma-70 family RNA polymerase sigma factor [Flavitalea sp. BT771]MDV6221692.1 sigma-70 family RNA polymerase sigma factor [Flavitalea sp. BT771]
MIFKKAYEAYKSRIYAMAYGMLQRRADAEDVTAEAFFELWKVREKIREDGHIPAFLYVAARHKCVNILLKRKRAPHISIEIIGQQEAVDTSHEEIDYLKTIKALEIAIEQLPAQQKEVIRRYYIEGLSMAEAAHKMNIDIKTAYTHRKRAVAFLLKLMKNKRSGLFISILLTGICGIFLKIMLRM